MRVCVSFRFVNCCLFVGLHSQIHRFARAVGSCGTGFVPSIHPFHSIHSIHSIVHSIIRSDEASCPRVARVRRLCQRRVSVWRRVRWRPSGCVWDNAQETYHR
ncbi:hypothetical protein DFJ73DRAFT_835039 [Zopfochytrium polystomum]|nr:hypothetical protein DFJ73DRAFT_835039 [Zopfochytrium polystomum]